MPRPNRAAYHRGLRERSFANGLCYQCCTRPHRPGKKTCQVCYGKMVARRNAAADRGLCREQCGRPWVAPFRRCAECRERRAAWARAKRAAGVTIMRRDPRAEPVAVPAQAPPSAPVNRLWLIADRARRSA